MLEAHVEVVVAAGCANEEDACVSLWDTTVAGIVFEVVMRTEVGVEDVKVAGLRTSGCGGQGGGLGHGMGAGWTASDAARASWTQYLQRPRGGGERPVGARCVAVWISARESTIAPDGLELICARQMGRR